MKKMCNFATYWIKVRRRQLITNNKNIKKMKKLIALALFAISALTVSAQSVQIIEKNGIKDTDVAAALLDTRFALVEQDNADLKAAVEEINKKVGNKELDREGALIALEDAIANIERAFGDYNLDGDVTLNDIQKYLDDFDEDEATFDYDGNPGISLNDIQALMNLYDEF